MKIKIISSVLILFFVAYSSSAQRKEHQSAKRARIQGLVPPDYKEEVIDLITLPVERITYTSDKPQTEKIKVLDRRIKRDFLLDKPVYVIGPFIGKQSKIGYQIEGGDDILIDYKQQIPIFSGAGASKWELIYKLGKLEDSLENTTYFKSLSKAHGPLKNVKDYFAWNNYLNIKLEFTLKLIESYKGQISTLSYNTIKEKALYGVEEKRMERFTFLITSVATEDISGSLAIVNRFGLTNYDLCNIFDSTMNGPAAKWLQFETSVVDDPYYLWEMLRFDALRERNMFFKNKKSDSSILGKDRVDGYVVRYNLAKRKYKGLIKEEVLSFFFHYSNGVFHNIGFDPKVEAMLADYYKQPGFSAYKQAVRECELEERKRQDGKRDLDFQLTDINGRLFSKEQLKDKIAVMDFWFTGCKGCIQLAPALLRIEDLFKKDTNIVFLNISVDENKAKWLESINRKKYTTGGGTNVYTSGEGNEHRIIKDFGVTAFPSVFVLDNYGRLMRRYPKLDPRVDSGNLLITILKRQLTLMNDGPYIWREDSLVKISLINGRSLFDRKMSEREKISFNVSSDKHGDSFPVKLQDKIVNQRSEFSGAKKIFVLSDVEGNLQAFRELLQSNKVIDENYNWIFGEGHLVFLGDMFDRGEQVTECLWMIYSLEEKAKTQGGYVHFILGNHEIMNLRGDNRYVHEKYKKNASLLEKSTKELYGINTELGKWLRTKNVIERIGDLLFAHGGISPEIVRSKLSITDINAIARRFYDKNQEQTDGQNVDLITGSSYSPFWYRGYYNSKFDQKYIDTTLNKYSVKHIITGHTIVSDTISIHYNGRIINTDTDHANGNSEALLFEYGNYYRVNAKGQKVELNVNDSKRKEEYISLN